VDPRCLCVHELVLKTRWHDEEEAIGGTESLPVMTEQQGAARYSSNKGIGL
jgi:hypothetical protein